jgi:hypothetical protein
MAGVILSDRRVSRYTGKTAGTMGEQRNAEFNTTVRPQGQFTPARFVAGLLA